MPLKMCGRFTLEDSILSPLKDRILCGPRDYMVEQGNALLDSILAGEDTIFNMTADHQGDLGQSPDVETSILVRLQTDYAGWVGLKQAEGWLKDAGLHS